ncbi:MAG: type II secretion system protein [Erysipelotrichia bacterium]|nr:type II secretion system protein [Erysipelotrichia bacterium]
MVKQQFNKGYTLIECLFVLFVTAILFTITSIKMKYLPEKSINEVINEIVMMQYRAIMENEYQYYEQYDMDIEFNRLGNVNHADSYDYDHKILIVSLGTGRVYEDEEGESFD